MRDLDGVYLEQQRDFRSGQVFAVFVALIDVRVCRRDRVSIEIDHFLRECEMQLAQAGGQAGRQAGKH